MVHQHRKLVGSDDWHQATTLVCFDCRYTAKAEASELVDRRCPACQKDLTDCGKGFRAPKKSDDEGWEAKRQWHTAKIAQRRADPYQARARELCQQAGVDPDSRVGEGRGLPAWCEYRDAARAEHLQREQQETAASIVANRPQAPEFQNSPLEISGEPDEATIAQMRNCMAVGNVVAGVICADGHLGYAQPVGGVIAYEKQISISGGGAARHAVRGDRGQGRHADQGRGAHDLVRARPQQ
jgi:hypothetical protein